jgi:hypothetical protein
VAITVVLLHSAGIDGNTDSNGGATSVSAIKRLVAFI